MAALCVIHKAPIGALAILPLKDGDSAPKDPLPTPPMKELLDKHIAFFRQICERERIKKLIKATLVRPKQAVIDAFAKVRNDRSKEKFWQHPFSRN